MSISDLSEALRTMFTDDELTELTKVTVQQGPRRSSVLNLAAAWSAEVNKIDDDRALPDTDRTVWTEHDLAGALFLRGFLEEALSQTPADRQERIRRYVHTVDQRYRGFTVEDSGERIAKVAGVDMTGREWWWFRVPDSGPIKRALASY